MFSSKDIKIGTMIGRFRPESWIDGLGESKRFGEILIIISEPYKEYVYINVKCVVYGPKKNERAICGVEVKWLVEMLNDGRATLL